MTVALAANLARLRENVGRVYRGETRTIDLVLTALLSRGHILIEDVPGVGKTTLARALGRSLSLDFRRIQFTSDTLPADVLGISVFHAASDRFEFHAGPLFANIVLADEINRATPKTQSALLEAMNEGAVTVESERRELPLPFMVVATQNPVEYLGTYPLPESQMDRFFLRLSL
jgi:MoxR-like ATPase